MLGEELSVSEPGEMEGVYHAGSQIVFQDHFQPWLYQDGGLMGTVHWEERLIQSSRSRRLA